MRKHRVSFFYYVSPSAIQDSWDKMKESGIRCEPIASPAEDRAARDVSLWLDAFFCSGTGWDIAHEYSWPDGSCYIRVAFDGDANVLRDVISDRLSRYGERCILPHYLRVESVEEIHDEGPRRRIAAPSSDG